MNNNITKEKVHKYRELTAKALEKIKKSIVKGEEEKAKEIIEMVENYVSDSNYFEEKNDLINAFAALNYCHGWIDAGVRLGIFDVDDDKLFTVK